MAKIPDVLAQGTTPSPQPVSGVASYEPPNWRQVGMAGDIVSGASHDLAQASSMVAAASDRQDAIVSMDAANKLKAAQLQLEQDPQSGFVNAKGNQVIGPDFVKGYMDKVNQARDQISDGLSNTNQKQMFREHADLLGLQFQSALLQHQAKETTAFNATTREDTVNLGLNDIAAHPYDENTYQTNQLLMGRTIVEAGKDLGLSGDALANFVRVGTSKLESKSLFYRTSGMLLDDPMKAADFFRQHELDFDPQDRMHLATTLKTAVDAQTSRVIGDQAFKSAIGVAPGAASPADMGGDVVRPMTQDRMQQVTDLVKKPSPYDALFQKYGQLYNVSPTELKLRAVVESSLNKDATSPQGALGLMQITPDTAKRLGIDPSDPEQAISGAAKLMAQSGGIVGGDMSAVDRAYYGGSTSAKGPNTDQYVENLRALRQHVMGAPQPILTQDILEGAEGRVIDNAKVLAQQQRPGDQVYQDMVVAEARKNWANGLASVRGANQEAVSNIMGLLASNTPPQSVSDLPVPLQKAFSQLPGTTQFELQKRMVSGDPPRTAQTQALMYQYLGKFANDKQGFANEDLSPLIPRLPHADFDRLATMQVAARNKQELEADKAINLQHALTVAQRWALDPIGIKGIDKNTSQEKRAVYDQFTGALSTEMDQFQSLNKRPPTDLEIVTMAKNLTATVQVPGKWYGTNDIRAFQINQDNQGSVTVKVPDDFRAGITQALTSAQNGKPPTEAQVQTAYLLHLRQPPKVAKRNVGAP